MTEQGKYQVRVASFRPYFTLSNQFLRIMIETAGKVTSSIHAPNDLVEHAHGELIKLEIELSLRN